MMNGYRAVPERALARATAYMVCAALSPRVPRGLAQPSPFTSRDRQFEPHGLGVWF
jgi:hypothetical protein